ncbi:MAG: SUMF1/EgtB/PvdO family nonheme iron enzyme [Paludibacteraceae bacterium]|nr:SUMF1/EgtB/PvdO family nonheme iron enzyme [Paludibacteraceae bacterium]
MKHRVLSLSLLLLLAQWAISQSLEVLKPLEEIQNSSVLVQYKNQFGKYEMPEKDIPFPFALIVMHLDGSASEVRTAKEMIQLDLGTQKKVVDQYLEKPNEIWFLVENTVKNIYIDCGEGCVKQLLASGVRLRSNVVYTCQVHYEPEQIVYGPQKSKITSQYLLINVTPSNAIVEVDGNLWTTNNGVAGNLLDFGEHSYRVSAPDYASAEGKVVVNDPENTQSLTVQLKPRFCSVTLRVENNAEIWVNGAKKGAGQWTGNLGYGPYRIETRLQGHVDGMVQQTISENDANRTITLPAPTPIYGSLRVETQPFMADIYLDGKNVGKTPKLFSEVIIGSHKVEVKMSGYENLSTTQTISEGQMAVVGGALTAQSKPTVTATSSGGNETFTVNGVSFEMVFVEGGTFTMGATSEQGSDADSDEKPTHSVTLSDYSIGKYEVTQALWQAVMGNNPSSFKGSTKPVESVSWNDCQSFISKLNNLLSSQLGGKRFALPTEAQWEYAARGGKKSQGYKYAGSNSISSVAWYTNNSGSSTHVVGTKSPNELGLYDMSGNVWEWCQDRYGDYSRSSQTNPAGPSSGSNRVFRGGRWNDLARYCRVSFRDFNTPSDRDYSLGFRLVLLP